jgi:GMP synthase (glutamine-hydrolysing)
MRLRVLLLQARKPGDPMSGHEHLCFAEKIELAPEQIVPYDLCEGPPATSAFGNHDAVMVGGSGDFAVSKGNLPHFEAYLDFLRETVARRHPAFLSCFGFQSVAHAMRGDLIADHDNREVGTYDVTLNEAGLSDELFGQLPRVFAAQLGHQERVRGIPDELVGLGSSERCPIQALRVTGAPVWGTQFHPELDRRRNLERLRAYAASYSVLAAGSADPPPDEEFFRESAEASTLLQRFVKLVFG